MILIIGPTSFLAEPIIRGLLDNGHNIKLFIRESSDISGLKKISDNHPGNITFAYGDLSDKKSVLKALKNIDSIIYLTDLQKVELLNKFMISLKLTDIKRVVFISSTTVLIPQENNTKELKKQSEDLISATGLDYTILRPSMIYGSPDDTNFSKMIRFVRKHKFFITFGKGDNLIQPVYIKDVSDSVTSVLNNKVTFKETYNLSGRSPVRYSDMLYTLKKKIGINFRIIRLPIAVTIFALRLYGLFVKNPVLKPDQVMRMKIDKAYSHDKAKRDFSYDPISLEEGIEIQLNEMGS